MRAQQLRLSLSGVQVPAEHLAAPFFEVPRHDGPLWRIPLVTLNPMGDE